MTLFQQDRLEPRRGECCEEACSERHHSHLPVAHFDQLPHSDVRESQSRHRETEILSLTLRASRSKPELARSTTCSCSGIEDPPLGTPVPESLTPHGPRLFYLTAHWASYAFVTFMKVFPTGRRPHKKRCTAAGTPGAKGTPEHGGGDDGFREVARCRGPPCARRHTPPFALGARAENSP